MKKSKFWLWLLPVAVLVLIAASPSFSDFISTQFAKTTDNKVAVKQGGTFTNILFSDTVASYPVVVTDTATSHGLIVMKDHTGATMADFTDLGISFNVGLQLNSLNASSILGLDGTKNVINWKWATNAFTAAATFPVSTSGQYSLTNAAGAVTFTSVSGTDASNVAWGTCIIDANGSDRTLTLPANWRVPDGVRTITVTNGTIGSLTVFCYANKYTNAFYRCGY